MLARGCTPIALFVFASSVACAALVAGCALDEAGTASGEGLTDSASIVIDEGVEDSTFDVQLHDTAPATDSGVSVDTSTPPPDTSTPPPDTTTPPDTPPPPDTAPPPPDTTPPPDTKPPPPDTTPPPDTGPTCTEAGSIKFGGHCYYFVAATENWANAKSKCAGAGAHLVTLNVAGERAAVGPLCASTDCWTDYVAPKATTTASDFYWDDGDTGFDGPWCVGEPSGDGDATSDCARLKGGGTCLADADCIDSFAYVCERD